MNRATLLKVFSTLHQRLVKQMTLLLGSREDAEDILQDSFCKLWHQPPENRDQDAPYILSATVRNMAIDQLRMKSSGSGNQRYSHHSLVPLDAVLHKLRAPEEDAAEERERQFQVVDRAIEEILTPLQRQIIHQREYEDKSYREIARNLRMSETAVRMQISRARQRIREYYLQNYKR